MTDISKHHKLRIAVLLVFLALVGPMAGLAGWYAARQLDPGLFTQMAATGSPLASVLYLTVAICLAGLVVALLAYFFVVKKVVAPLTHFVDQFEQLSFVSLSAPSQQTQGALHRQPPLQQLARFHETLTRSIARACGQLGPIQLQATVIGQSSRNLAERFGQQTSALQQTTGNMEQLAETVRQNADNARQANQLAVTASEVAQRGGAAVDEVVSTMHQIAASSQKISDIVGVIDSIAFQTNILALNAAVEAARAGEQGKGFAVVAAEVRALAQRSAHAAREIKDLIDDSSKRVSEGSGQVERAGTTMQEILGSVARVTDIMGEISAATLEQTTGIEEVKQVVGEMGHLTRDNTRLFEESASAVQQLSGHVQTLGQALAPLDFSGAMRQGLSVNPAVPGMADAAGVGSAALSAPVRSVPALAARATQAPEPQAANAQLEAPARGRHSARPDQAVAKQPVVQTRQPTQSGHAAAVASVAALATAHGASAQSPSAPLLRPNLQNGVAPYQSAEDDWEEF